jgi:hypothetical protein
MSERAVLSPLTAPMLPLPSVATPITFGDGGRHYSPLALDVLRIVEGKIVEIVTFDGSLFDALGLPSRYSEAQEEPARRRCPRSSKPANSGSRAEDRPIPLARLDSLHLRV